MNRLSSAAAVLSLFMCASMAQAADEPPQRCDASAFAILARQLKVAHFALRDADPEGVVVTAVCQRMPDHPRLTLAAMAWDAGREGSKSQVLAMFDEHAGTVAASRRDEIQEDASVQFSDYSLHLDTAPYVLAPGVRAIGLDFIGHNPRCGGGGLGPQRTLYVREGAALRPVLVDLFMQTWRYSGAQPGCGSNDETPVYEQFDVTIGVGAGRSHGWADLELTARASEDAPARKPLRVRVPYDGKAYSLESFNKAYEAWRR